MKRSGLLVLAWLAFILVEILALRAAPEIPFTDDLDATFRGDFPQFLRFQERLDEFGRADDDIIVLFEAETLAAPGAIRQAEDLLIELQFLDGVAAIISPFSFSLTGSDGVREPLLHSDLVADEIEPRLREALATEPGLDRFLSADLSAMQAIVLISEMPPDTRDRSVFLERFRDLADEIAAAGPAEITLTGFPVVRDSVTRRLDADFNFLNVAGLVAGMAIALVALRSLVLAVMIALTAQTARLWSITALLPLGYDINSVTVTLPTLILVLSFAEAIHLGMAARRFHADGKPQPLRRAMLSVWPAAFLAAVTTVLAFSGLLLTQSELVSSLGIYAVIAIAISTPLVFAIFGLFAGTLDRLFGFARLIAPPRHRENGSALLQKLAGFVRARHRSISVSGLLVVAISTLGYLSNEPDYNLFEGLSEDDTEIAALRRIESDFGPLTTLEFEHPTYPPERLRDARATLSAISPWGDAFALDPETRDDLPDVFRDRLFSDDGSTTLISLPFPYDGSSDALLKIAEIEARIATEPTLSELGPPTGVTHVSANVSAEILGAFSLCFAAAAALASVLIAIWLKSPALGVISVLPNVLPITVAGAIIWMTGQPYSFTGGIALTIAFGIAIDDAIHMINRARQEAESEGAWTKDGVCRALVGIGPALILTSLILIGGLAGTLFSSLGQLVDFGILTISVFVLALLADLVLLPALVMTCLDFMPLRAPRSRQG